MDFRWKIQQNKLPPPRLRVARGPGGALVHLPPFLCPQLIAALARMKTAGIQSVDLIEERSGQRPSGPPPGATPTPGHCAWFLAIRLSGCCPDLQGAFWHCGQTLLRGFWASSWVDSCGSTPSQGGCGWVSHKNGFQKRHLSFKGDIAPKRTD